MFNGLPATTTPNYQFWDLTKAPNPINSAPRITLTDDCAPFQYIVTGGINGYAWVDLPVNPAPGKTITIKVDRGGGSYPNGVYVRDPVTAAGSVTNSYSIASIAPSQQCVFVYIPEATSSAGGNAPRSGWVSGNGYTFGNNRDAGGPLNHGSAVLGGYDCYTGGAHTVVCGGRANQAGSTSTIYSFVGGGRSNSVGSAGNYSSIVGGISNQASSGYSFVGGGNGNNILSGGGYSAIVSGITNQIQSVQSAFIGGGQNNVISYDYACILGGRYNKADAQSSAVIGSSFGQAKFATGIVATAASSGPINSVAGTSQTELLIVARETVDNTPTILASDSNTPSSYNNIGFVQNFPAATYVRGSVIAYCATTNDSKQWTFDCIIKYQFGGVNVIEMVGSPTPVSTYSDTGASAWSISLGVDTTTNTFQVTAVGDPTNPVRFVCRLETTEVMF